MPNRVLAIADGIEGRGHPEWFASVVGVEARYRLSQRLSLASAAHLFFDVIPAVEHARGISRIQDFERLSLHIHFGSTAALVVDLQTAMGGELGGSIVAGGLRAAVNLR